MAKILSLTNPLLLAAIKKVGGQKALDKHLKKHGGAGKKGAKAKGKKTGRKG